MWNEQLKEESAEGILTEVEDRVGPGILMAGQFQVLKKSKDRCIAKALFVEVWSVSVLATKQIGRSDLHWKKQTRQSCQSVRTLPEMLCPHRRKLTTGRTVMSIFLKIRRSSSGAHSSVSPISPRVGSPTPSSAGFVSFNASSGSGCGGLMVQNTTSVVLSLLERQRSDRGRSMMARVQD